MCQIITLVVKGNVFFPNKSVSCRACDDSKDENVYAKKTRHSKMITNRQHSKITDSGRSETVKGIIE